MPPMNIMIRMIRKNGNPKNDDMIVIDRMGLGQYSLKYTYGDTIRKTPYTIIVNDRMLLRWVRIAIRLLENDSDPFSSVQFDFPTMPSIMVDIPQLSKAYHTLLDAVEFTVDNWPMQPQHHEVIEEDDFDDMPPLVPTSPPAGYWNRHLFM